MSERGDDPGSRQMGLFGDPPEREREITRARPRIVPASNTWEVYAHEARQRLAAIYGPECVASAERIYQAAECSLKGRVMLAAIGYERFLARICRRIHK